MVGNGFTHNEMQDALDAVGVHGYALGRNDISDRIGRICYPQ